MVQKIYSPEKIVRIRIGYEWCIDVSIPPSMLCCRCILVCMTVCLYSM
jgi:hypothetical protein